MRRSSSKGWIWKAAGLRNRGIFLHHSLERKSGLYDGNMQGLSSKQRANSEVAEYLNASTSTEVACHELGGSPQTDNYFVLQLWADPFDPQLIRLTHPLFSTTAWLSYEDFQNIIVDPQFDQPRLLWLGFKEEWE